MGEKIEIKKETYLHLEALYCIAPEYKSYLWGAYERLKCKSDK